MGSYPPMYICHESLGRPSSTCPTILLVLRLFPVILIFYVAWRYFVRMVSTCFARVVAHGSDSFQPRHTSISDTGVPRSMAKNLLTTLIVTVYFPEVALLPDGMIIENSLISDATLEHLIEQFDGEEHKTLLRSMLNLIRHLSHGIAVPLSSSFSISSAMMIESCGSRD